MKHADQIRAGETVFAGGQWRRVTRTERNGSMVVIKCDGYPLMFCWPRQGIEVRGESNGE
jgi:hypothetical protein